MFGWFKSNKEADIMSSLLLIIEQREQEDCPNKEAYEWLDRAMFSSSRIKKKERLARKAERKRVYPISAYQTEKMYQLLKKAKEVVVDPSDELFVERYNELNDIVKWSSKRHTNWSWVLILGLFLSALAYAGICVEQDLYKIKPLYDGKRVVRQWEDPQTTERTPTKEELESKAFIQYGDVEKFREMEIFYLKNQIFYCEEDYKSIISHVDSVSTDFMKKFVVKFANSQLSEVDTYAAELEAIPAMDFVEFKEYAIYAMDRKIKENYKEILKYFYAFGGLFLVITIIYMIAQLPHGYTVTRLRIETMIFGWINELTILGLVMGIFGSIFSWENTDKSKEKYSSKAKREEAEEAAMLYNVIKFILPLLFTLILVAASLFLVCYQILQGLRRNYTLNRFIARRIDYTKRYANE